MHCALYHSSSCQDNMSSLLFSIYHFISNWIFFSNVCKMFSNMSIPSHHHYQLWWWWLLLLVTVMVVVHQPHPPIISTDFSLAWTIVVLQILHSPNSVSANWCCRTGIFSLTDLGLDVIGSCREQSFHYHAKEPPLFEVSKQAWPTYPRPTSPTALTY